MVNNFKNCPGEEYSISDIRFDPRNSKKHGEPSISHIAKSLKQFGQQKPIVLMPNLTVLAGNGTLAAAKALEWTHIKAHVTNLTGNDAKAYAIADNKTAEYADWDFSTLTEVIQELDDGEYDLTNTGFDKEELERIMGWCAVDVEKVNEDKPKDNNVVCPNCKHEFAVR